MRRIVVLLLCSALLACGKTEAEPPAPAVTPQPITYPDIEANQLYGLGCAFSSGSSMAPIILATPQEAVLKIDGEIHRFRIDSESEGASLGSRSRYLAEDRVLYLTIEGEGATGAEKPVNFAGSVRLLDGAGAELYATTGTVQCGS